MRRGFTLTEMIVAFGLLGLTSLLTYQLLVPGLRAWRAANEHSRMQQNAYTAVTRLSHEIQQTCIMSVTTGTWNDEFGKPQPWVAFVSPYEPDSGRFVQDPDTGAIKWQEYRVFYLDGFGQMHIGSRPLRLDDKENLFYQLPYFMPDLGNDRILARFISRFVVQPAKIWGGYDPFKGYAPNIQPGNPVFIQVTVHDERDIQQYVMQTAVWTLLMTN